MMVRNIMRTRTNTKKSNELNDENGCENGVEYSEIIILEIFSDRQLGVLTPGPPMGRDPSQGVTVEG